MKFLLMVLLAINFSAMDSFSFSLNEIREKITDSILEEIKVMNRQTPMMIDPTTRIDFILYSNMTTFYKITLLEDYFYGLSRNEIKTIFSLAKENTKPNFCNNDDVLFTFYHGYSVRYEYYNEDGQHIDGFEINKIDCRSGANKNKKVAWSEFLEKNKDFNKIDSPHREMAERLFNDIYSQEVETGEITYEEAFSSIASIVYSVYPKQQPTLADRYPQYREQILESLLRGYSLSEVEEYLEKKFRTTP